MNEQSLITLLFAEVLIGCLLSIRYLELKMTFWSYISINSSGLGILKRKPARLYNILLFLVCIAFLVLPMKMQLYNNIDWVYGILMVNAIIIMLLVRENNKFNETLAHNALLNMLIAIEKEDIVRRFTYSEAEDILEDYKKSLPWYQESITILACKPLLNKLLLEELQYVKYRYCGHC